MTLERAPAIARERHTVKHTGQNYMKRTTTTVTLAELWCSAAPVERVIAATPGVIRVFVSPMTQMAYVEFDADRCDERDILHALASLGVRAAAHPPADG